MVRSAVPGCLILVNKELPRKGTFEVACRSLDGSASKTLLSLVGMPRRFDQLRATNLDGVFCFALFGIISVPCVRSSCLPGDVRS